MRQLLRYQCGHYDNSELPMITIVIYQGKYPMTEDLPNFQDSLKWGDNCARHQLDNEFGSTLLNFISLNLKFVPLSEGHQELVAELMPRFLSRQISVT